MEKIITVDISEENGNVYISEDGSSGATYRVDFSKGNKKIIEDVKKAINTYITNYLIYEPKMDKEDEYEVE